MSGTFTDKCTRYDFESYTSFKNCYIFRRRVALIRDFQIQSNISVSTSVLVVQCQVWDIKIVRIMKYRMGSIKLQLY
jgi:hypothetical protein